MENEDYDVKPDNMWIGSAHIETPEEYVLRKEREKERRGALTEKQREVYELFMQGYTQVEIAKLMGISQPAVNKLYEKVIKKCKSIEEKN